MSQFQSKALQELSDRGFLYQCSDLEALDVHMARKPITFYCGYDATAKSLHVGNLLSIMAARILQRHGHRPLMLMGGGTTKIGDPTDKAADRKLLSVTEIDENIQGIQRSLSTFVDFSDQKTNSAVLLNNDEWLKDIGYLEFLRSYGPHFTINRMLAFDSVKTRLDRESPLSFLEFNYILIQAYDFLYLNRTYNCQLQIGGSDQWANILNGHELIRKLERKPSYALTFPLITNSSGQKMGKTLSGAVWLNADMMSPYDYWQFWRNVEDADVIRFMKYYTDLPLEEIQIYERFEGEALNEAKKRLADEATRLAHDSECLSEIHATVAALFGSQNQGVACSGKDERGNDIIETTAPLIQVSTEDFENGYPLIKALMDLEFCLSKGEGRRLIQGGGCRVNDIKVLDTDHLLTQKAFQAYALIKVAAGKKKIGYIQVIQ
jgi:tyrosyl-tRNA synthetase